MTYNPNPVISAQEKAAIAYAVARETHDPQRAVRTVYWQLLAAHQSALARAALGITEAQQ